MSRSLEETEKQLRDALAQGKPEAKGIKGLQALCDAPDFIRRVSAIVSAVSNHKVLSSDDEEEGLTSRQINRKLLQIADNIHRLNEDINSLRYLPVWGDVFNEASEVGATEDLKAFTKAIAAIDHPHILKLFREIKSRKRSGRDPVKEELEYLLLDLAVDYEIPLSAHENSPLLLLAEALIEISQIEASPLETVRGVCKSPMRHLYNPKA